MIVGTLKLIMMAKGLNEADIARCAGVSRQAVNVWLSQCEFANINTKNLMQLCHSLKLKPDELLNPLYSDEEKLYYRNLEKELLWDKLYPSIESFFLDLARGRLKTIARFVQVFGLYRASKLVGKKVWTKFPMYKNLLHPSRRKECELVWKLKINQK